jgi:hypothetical protein
MASSNKTIRRLNGGVSQQPDSQRRDSQCTAQTNFLSDVVDGLIKRPGSNFLGEFSSDTNSVYNAGQDGDGQGHARVFTHEIIREGDTKLLLSVCNSKLRLIDLENGYDVDLVDENDVAITTGSQTYLGITGSYDTHPYAAVTIADTTFILNKEKVPAMKNPITGGATFNHHERRRGTIFIKEGAYNAEYTVTATDHNGEERNIRVTTSDGLGSGNVNDSKTDNICAAIHAALTDTATSRTNITFNTTNYPGFADEDTGIKITYTQTDPGYQTVGVGSYWKNFYREGSVLLWQANFTAAPGTEYDDTEVNIFIEDSYGDTLSDSFTETRGSFEGLPLTSADQYLLQITGAPESPTDDYYVKFDIDKPNHAGSERGKGRWVESLAPGIKYKIDETTMPHELVKVNATKYKFQPVTWTDKTVGDNITDPDPSFIGKKINDIFFFKSRLGLLSGENVILSELDDPYNFWRTTVTQVLATDRIDIQSSVNEITELRFAVPFANQMVIFSDRTQFIIAYGSQGLTPSTASLAQIASYECSKNVSPIAVDNNIIFAQNRASATAIYEMFPTGTTELSFEAQEITQQIPTYIQGNTIRLAGSSLANTVIVQTDNSANELYMYKYFNQGRDRVLSSWFKYTFPVRRIKGIHYVDDKCYKVNAIETLASPGSDATHVLDFFRVDNTTTLTHNVDFTIPHTDMYSIALDGSGDTDVRLPLENNTNSVLIGDYFDRTGNLVVFDDQNVLATLKAPTGSNDIKIEGDWTSKTFYVGVLYDAEYEFSKQYIKRGDSFGQEVPLVNGRTTVKWAEVYVSNTQYLKMEVSYPNVNRDTTTKSISGNIAGEAVLGDQNSETGTLRSVVAARNDVPTIKLINNTHQTSKVNGASFNLMYTSKIRGRN